MARQTRRVEIHEVDVVGSGGHPKLWGWGREWLRRAAGMASTDGWRKLVGRRGLDEGRPLLVVAEILEQRAGELGPDAEAGARALRGLDEKLERELSEEGCVR